jgi:hypothetical protein
MIAIANYFFMRKGDSQRFHLGNVTLNTKTPGKVMPGETFHCLVDVDADKFKLLPGSYYLILEIRGLPLSPKAFYLAYAEKKLVSLTK